MNAVFVVAAVAAMLSAAVLAWLLRTIVWPRAGFPGEAWVAGFDATKYRLLRRLAESADVSFLEAQPGCTPGILRAFRSGRRRVFIGALSVMRKDFDRLSVAAKLAIVHSGADRSHLLAELLEQRCRFELLLLRVRMSIALDFLGVRQPDVAGLVAGVERMSQLARPVEVRALAS
jgi:hypothetical protein